MLGGLGGLGGSGGAGGWGGGWGVCELLRCNDCVTSRLHMKVYLRFYCTVLCCLSMAKCSGCFSDTHTHKELLHTGHFKA